MTLVACLPIGGHTSFLCWCFRPQFQQSWSRLVCPASGVFSWDSLLAVIALTVICLAQFLSMAIEMVVFKGHVPARLAALLEFCQ